jgi:hypothetical protein
MQQQVYNKLQQVYNTASEQHQVQHQVRQVYTILYINNLILIFLYKSTSQFNNCNTTQFAKAFFSMILKLKTDFKQLCGGGAEKSDYSLGADHPPPGVF